MKEFLELVITTNKGLSTNWKTATARERLEELFTTETVLKKTIQEKTVWASVFRIHAKECPWNYITKEFCNRVAEPIE